MASTEALPTESDFISEAVYTPDEYLATPQQNLDIAHTAKRLQRLSGAAIEISLALGGLIYAPYFAVKHAPPAHIERQLITDPNNPDDSSARFDVRIIPGRDVTAVRADFATMYLPKSERIAGVDIAADVNIDIAKLKFIKDINHINVGEIQHEAEQLARFQPEFKQVISAVGEHYKHTAMTAEEVMLGLEAAGFSLLQLGKWNYGRTPAGSRKYVLSAYCVGAGATIAALAGGAGAYALTHDSYAPPVPGRNELHADPIFDDIPALKGGQVESAAQPFIDMLVTYLNEYFTKVSNYEHTVETNMAAENMRLYGTPATPKAEDVIREDDMDDLQGRYILALVETRAFKKDGGDTIYLPGDVTFAAKDPFVIDTIKNELGKKSGIKVAAARSEHDDETTVETEKKADFYVSNADPKNPADIGTVQKINGQRVLIANYPERAPFGKPSYEIEPGVQTFIQNLQKAICEQQPDVVIEHDSNTVGAAIGQTNCVEILGHPAKDQNHTTAFIDGRSYTVKKPRVFQLNGYGRIVEVISASSGGLTAEAGPSVLIPDNPGSMTETDYYKKLNIRTVQIKTIYPDGSVHFSPEMLTDPSDEPVAVASGLHLRPGSDSVPEYQQSGHK